MARGCLALKATQCFFAAIEFCCAAAILAIFSYFLATLHSHGLDVNNYIRSIEGISGAAALYTICGMLLLWFLAGLTFFAALALLIDIAFVAAFIYVAYQTRGGTSTCFGYVNTPIGNGDAGSDSDHAAPAPQGGVMLLLGLRQACRLETACFAAAIVAIISFLISAMLELALWRCRRAERAFGPSPANNYTAGPRSRRRFWGHHCRDEADAAALENSRSDALPMHTTPADVRDLHHTENTAVKADPVGYSGGKFGASDRYGSSAHAYSGGPGYQGSGITDSTNY